MDKTYRINPCWGEYTESDMFNKNVTFLLCGKCLAPIGYDELSNKHCFRCGTDINIENLDFTNSHFSPSRNFIIKNKVSNEKLYLIYGKQMTFKEIQQNYPQIANKIER